MPDPFAHVALLFCDDPPEWIAKTLVDFAPLVAPLVGGLEVTHTHQDFLDDVALIIALHKVEEELGPYLDPTYLDRLDDNTRDAFENLGEGVWQVLAHLKETLDPPPVGRPRKLGRHLCAKVCADIWAHCHGKDQPWSTKLHDACQAYWIACRGTADSISWRNILNGYD
jgi:hypothetical protein